MNAKLEFLNNTSGKKVKCAFVNGNHLKIGYDEDDFQTFLSALDFEYDSVYGTQELYGMVWFEYDSWLESHEYDGCEWWEL